MIRQTDIHMVPRDPGVRRQIPLSVNNDRRAQRDDLRVHSNHSRPRREPRGRHPVRPASAALHTGAIGRDGAFSDVPVGPNGLIGRRLLRPCLPVRFRLEDHRLQLLHCQVPHTIRALQLYLVPDRVLPPGSFQRRDPCVLGHVYR